LVLFALGILPMLLMYVVNIASTVMMARNHANPNVPLGFMAAFAGIACFCVFIMILLYPGMTVTALKQIRGEEISVGDLFSGPRYFFPSLAIGLVTGLGVLLCGVGALFTGGLLFMALPLVIDRRVTVSEAISLSWSTAKSNLWLYVLYAFVAGMLNGAGGMACYVGYIATISFMPLAQVVAYVRTFEGSAIPTMPMPGAIPPPYSATPYLPSKPGTLAGPPYPAGHCPLCGVKQVEGISNCPQCGASWVTDEKV